MKAFTAFRIHKDGKGVKAGFEQLMIDDLTEGEVVIKVSYSGINYKDALAATGKGRILRSYPLNGGVDLAGRVVQSQVDALVEGDSVLVCGCGLSETVDGGFAEYARVPGCCVVKMPDGLDEYEAMIIGTAGFTAGLAVQRMEDNGQAPDMGPILITGATGGVGSLAINMFSQLGYEVVALSGKTDQDNYLASLGASHCIDRNTLNMGEKPMEKALWAGAVDTLGGQTLSWLTRVIKPWGSIASIGLAQGWNVETTVMPFILRGVSILGINSIEMPTAVREKVWTRLGADLKPTRLNHIVAKTIAFSELPGVFDEYMQARVVGRTVVRIAD